MRNAIALGVVFLFLLVALDSAYCEGPVSGSINKLGRGLCNAATFHFEVFEQSRRVKAKDGWLAGMVYGLPKGIIMAGVRGLVGVYEVATFFIPYPKDYEPILTDPVSFFPEPKK